MKKTGLMLLAAALLLGQSPYAQACTGIAFAAQDGTQLQARTIEWAGYPLGSKLIILPRGQKHTSLTLGGQNGLSWTNKYGAAGISVVKDEFIGEGINEKGLAAGVFYFVGYGSLGAYNPKKASKSVGDMELVGWLLTNFATVEEALKGLKKVEIVPIYPPEKGQTSAPTGHWRIADATGRSVVLEIENGGVHHIYENTAGVLTNSPAFPWQTTNLNNYVHMQTGEVHPQNLGGTALKAFGAGSGMWGLPGDITPPSRFVRAFFYNHTAPMPKDAQAGVLQAFHILNNFDIPIGVEFADKSQIPDMPSATQWTTVTDMTHPALYYRTMYNSRIRKVDLGSIDFSTVGYQVLPLDKTSEEIEQIRF